MMSVRLFGSMLVEALKQWRKNEAPRQAAALAYYAVFSIAPVFVLALALVALVFDQEVAAGVLDRQLRQWLPSARVATFVEDLVVEARQASGLTATFALLTTFWAATNIFHQLKISLNTVWRTHEPNTSGVSEFIKARVVALLFVLVAGGLLLASVLASTALNLVVETFGGFMPDLFMLVRGNVDILQVGQFAITLAVVTVLFGLMYRVLPDRRVAWRDVGVGAIFTAVLFTVGSTVVSMYLARSGLRSSFGAAGSVVVLLLWVNISAQIFLYGAEFTRVFAERVGTRKTPPLDAAESEDRDTSPGAAPAGSHSH